MNRARVVRRQPLPLFATFVLIVAAGILGMMLAVLVTTP